MAKYFYLDIETYSTGVRPDPVSDKIITIQFQQIEEHTGKPLGELRIFKEWDSNEEAILRKFVCLFRPWDFVPIGNNLNFERMFLKAKCKQHKIPDLEQYGDLAYSFPSIDIQPLFVILNKGQFKGCGMHNFTNKKTDGSHIAKWYTDRDFDKIEEYIKDETAAFLEFYQKCHAELPKILMK
ncbi:MAG: hypothetical protein ABII22_05520 [Candidatus Micrarchaeota archaeon]